MDVINGILDNMIQEASRSGGNDTILRENIIKAAANIRVELRKIEAERISDIILTLKQRLSKLEQRVKEGEKQTTRILV